MSPLQFFLVTLLFDGPQTGPQLRRRLQAAGLKASRSSFSRLIHRMQTANYVSADTKPTPSGRRLVHPHRFRLTDLGLAVWTRVRDFHAVPGPPPGFTAVVTGHANLADLPVKHRKKTLDRRDKQQLNRLFRKYLTAYKNRPSQP